MFSFCLQCACTNVILFAVCILFVCTVHFNFFCTVHFILFAVCILLCLQCAFYFVCSELLFVCCALLLFAILILFVHRTDYVILQLRQIHPEAQEAKIGTHLHGPVQEIPESIYLEINGEMIREAALRTKRSSGPSGVDANGFKRILC